jgi:hypothetical protein
MQAAEDGSQKDEPSEKKEAPSTATRIRTRFPRAAPNVAAVAGRGSTTAPAITVSEPDKPVEAPVPLTTISPSITVLAEIKTDETAKAEIVETASDGQMAAPTSPSKKHLSFQAGEFFF